MTSDSTRSQESQSTFSMTDFEKALEQHDYQFKVGQVVRGKVFQHSADGAYIDIGGKSPGFVPIREASLQPYGNLSHLLPLDEEVELLIIREQNAEGQVTLSRRQLELKQAWDEIIEMADSGESVQMQVTGTNRGGVIGDVAGLRGFIPRSHLLEKEDLDSLVGQSLTAHFLEVNPDNNKLVLSQRHAQKAAAISKLEPQTLVTGKVARIQPYGVFVDIGGVTGLLHIKQVSNTHIDSLNTIFQVGQEIKVMIVQIDEYKNRISLSTKILENYPGEVAENLEQVMANAEERVEQAKEKLTEQE